MKQQQGSVVLFYSCDPSDDILCDKLARFLRPLVREAHVEEWSTQQVLAGADFAQERKRALESATHILLLLSADYLASDVCDQEMRVALERQKRGEARIIPILLRPCLLPRTLDASLSCLPDNGQPVSIWRERDEAFRDVAQDICRSLGLPLASLRRRSTDRDRLLDRVFIYWIEGLLESSLEGRPRLDLSLQEQPDALDHPDAFVNPWHGEVRELHPVLRPLSAGMSIIQVYDAANGELLILGEPGAGKTTLLLELTRVLLKRAEKEEGARMPVVFHLSSWAKKKRALGAWLVEELATKYQVSRKISQSWIDANAILPLLDGLDEVAEPARAACAQAIEVYHAQAQRELVVCCRREEYSALPKRFTLQRAICVQPLTDNQIEYYLQQAEQSTPGQLQGLRQVLHNDRELNELAHRPLMLRIFTLAYQGIAPTDLPTGATQEQILHAVFADYVRRVLSRRGPLKSGTEHQMLRRLTFLAARMQQHHQTEFHLERMQPSWLTNNWTQQWYRLCCGLVTGLSAMTLSGLLAELSFGSDVGVGVGVLAGLLLGLIFGLPKGRSDQIEPAEELTGTWGKFLFGASRGLITGLALGLCSELLVGLGSEQGIVLLNLLRSGILGGILGLLVFGLGTSLSRQQPIERTAFSPNEGIWRSAKNGLVFGLLGGLFFGLIGGLGAGLGVGLPGGLNARSGIGLLGGLGAGLVVGLLGGLFFGLLSGLFFGLDAFLAHFILRFWLWRTSPLPWKLATFLDEAVERLLLRNVGGGYIFVHRLLSDYFASKEP